MFDNLHIIDTLRKAGFEAGSITVNPQPLVRDVTITGANNDPVTGERLAFESPIPEPFLPFLNAKC